MKSVKIIKVMMLQGQINNRIKLHAVPAHFKTMRIKILAIYVGPCFILTTDEMLNGKYLSILCVIIKLC